MSSLLLRESIARLQWWRGCSREEEIIVVAIVVTKQQQWHGAPG